MNSRRIFLTLLVLFAFKSGVYAQSVALAEFEGGRITSTSRDETVTEYYRLVITVEKTRIVKNKPTIEGFDLSALVVVRDPVAGKVVYRRVVSLKTDSAERGIGLAAGLSLADVEFRDGLELVVMSIATCVNSSPQILDCKTVPLVEVSRNE